MKILLALALVPLMLNTGSTGQTKAYRKTEKLFRKELNKKDVHNALLLVSSDSFSTDWTFTGGNFRDGTPVLPETPFYTASIGKTFTAVAIALLYQDGVLHFQDPIHKYLPDSLLKGLHVWEGTDHSREISIAQLLQHRSGLPDYFEDGTTDGTPNVLEQLITDSARFWEPTELLDFTRKHQKPLFLPGQGYHYTDTEYLLLGLLIERLSGKTLHEFFHTRIFQPLGLTDTRLHLHPITGNEGKRMAELYAGETEVSGFTSLSADWAGGGIVSTLGDLNRFIRALFGGQLLDEKTLELMQDWAPETRGMYYGFGLRKVVLKELFPTLPPYTLIGHMGSTGSFLFYCPERNLYFAGTLNQTTAVRQSVALPAKILAVLRKYSGK